jgi:hypothetical protein
VRRLAAALSPRELAVTGEQSFEPPSIEEHFNIIRHERAEQQAAADVSASAASPLQQSRG